MTTKIIYGVLWFLAVLTVFMVYGLKLFGQPSLVMALVGIIILEAMIAILKP